MINICQYVIVVYGIKLEGGNKHDCWPVEVGRL